MEDRVGSHVPSEKELRKLVDEVKAVNDKLARFGVDLATDERKSILKMRPGGDKLVKLVADLAREYKVELPGITVDGMLRDLELSERVAPLAAALESAAQRAQDTVLEAQGECWWAATAYYTALARASGANKQLESALKPVVDFFALGRRVRATTPPPPAKP